MGRIENNRQYQYGSTARKLAPQREREHEERRLHTVETHVNYAERINNRNRRRFNAVYTLGMIASFCAVFVVCIHYLALQSEVSQKADMMAQLEQQYAKLKADNDYLEVYIDSNIDYEHILDVAINELGMVYANSSQVVSYESEDIEYVKQYNEIPQSK